MNERDLNEPKFIQPEVLEVSSISADTLQTWVNRGLVELVEQSPGTGRRRLYRALDIVRVEIMRNLTSFGVSPSRAKEMAEDATEELESIGKCRADSVFVVRPAVEGEKDTIVYSRDKEPYRLGDHHHSLIPGDPESLTLKKLAGMSNFSAQISDAIGRPNGGEAILVVRIGEIIKNVLRRIEIMTQKDQRS